MVNIMVDDRLPDEAVSLNFHATPEALDKFLGILEQDGLKFTLFDFIPGFLSRIIREKFLKEERTSAKMLLSSNN
jgi:hypothetical protein